MLSPSSPARADRGRTHTADALRRFFLATAGGSGAGEAVGSIAIRIRDALLHFEKVSRARLDIASVNAALCADDGGQPGGRRRGTGSALLEEASRLLSAAPRHRQGARGDRPRLAAIAPISDARAGRLKRLLLRNLLAAGWRRSLRETSTRRAPGGAPVESRPRSHARGASLFVDDLPEPEGFCTRRCSPRRGPRPHHPP